MNLRSKFHIGSACMILIVVIGMMVSLYTAERKQLWSQIEDEQKTDLTKLAGVCEQSMLASDELILINYVKTLSMSPKVSFAGFVAKDGSGWIYSKKNRFELTDVDDPAVQGILKSHGLLKREIFSDKQEQIMALSQPVRDRGYVRLGYSKNVVISMFTKSVQAKLKTFTVVGFIAIIFGLILSQLFSRALSNPLNLLMIAAESIGKGKKGVQIPVHGADEIAHLTKTFNTMSSELSKLDELKEDFMSHVTHELRSPLTSIIATVELLAENPLMHKDPKLKRSIDRLTYGSERLNKLVDNILDLTKLEAGKMNFDIQPVDMGHIIGEMADFFEPRALEKGLSIRSQAPRNLPLAMADPERIRQVLSNLIHNAIKFTNKGEIVLWVREHEGKIQVAVQDSGVGIPREKLASVFQKFECLQDTRNRVEKPVPGSGLGLNIVLNSIKAQGGNIWVESEMEKGSTFVFTLPLAPAEYQEKYLKSMAKETALSAKNDVVLHREPVLIKEKKSAS